MGPFTRWRRDEDPAPNSTVQRREHCCLALSSHIPVLQSYSRPRSPPLAHLRRLHTYMQTFFPKSQASMGTEDSSSSLPSAIRAPSKVTRPVISSVCSLFMSPPVHLPHERIAGETRAFHDGVALSVLITISFPPLRRWRAFCSRADGCEYTPCSALGNDLMDLRVSPRQLQ